MKSTEDFWGTVGGVMVWAGIAYGVWWWSAPEPGYIRPHWWKPFAHEWVPATRHPQHPHVYAGEVKDRWHADPGYLFVNDTFTVQWTPNRDHPDSPNIRSTPQEGEWAPKPGYGYPQAFSLVAQTPVWMPGKAHPTCPNIVAGEKERHWLPVSGFRFVSQEPNKFDVVRLETPSSPPPSASPSALEVVGWGTAAAIAAYIASPESGDGFWTSVGRFVMKLGRDEAASRALQAFKNPSPAPVPAPQVIPCDYWSFPTTPKNPALALR